MNSSNDTVESIEPLNPAKHVSYGIVRSELAESTYGGIFDGIEQRVSGSE